TKPTADTQPVAKDRIVAATVAALRATPGAALTLDDVARRAGCAKGLVNYHFKTKEQLLSAAGSQLWKERQGRWREALGTADPEEAIGAGWRLLVSEASDGTATA